MWINLYHAVVNGHSFTESDIQQQMNITQRSFKLALNTLVKYGLLLKDNREFIIILPTMADLQEKINSNAFAYEQERRFVTLLETFHLKRGQAPSQVEVAAANSDANQLTPQVADEFATRFITECNFRPSRQLRDRFDDWFSQIQDQRLLEELLERTKHKIDMDGIKGGCPSRYTDKIVSQWVTQGIKSYEDLLRLDKEFQARCQFHRAVEKELGRGYNTLTPAEKEIIDKWAAQVESPAQLASLVREAILSGDYQGKGAPTLGFIDAWLEGKNRKKQGETRKKGFTHEHKISDLEKLVQRKTMKGLEDEANEG